MAETLINDANKVKRWSKEFFYGYVRDSAFYPFMGKDEFSCFQVNMDLTKEAGDAITITLIKPNIIQNSNVSFVTGNTALKGNEDVLANFGHRITVDMIRHGYVLHKMERQRTVIDMIKAAEAGNKYTAMDLLRDAQIKALMSPALDNTAYFLASEAQKDAFLTANSDRVLFGSAKANTVAGDHSASLLNVDNTNDKLTPQIISLAKRMAKTATNGTIRPIRVNGSEEWFVWFAPSQAFRDLKTDAAMTQANREAWTRGADNPLFTDGDLIFDGVIIREVPEIPIIPGVGAGGIDVAANFLCGAQAIGIGWAQEPEPHIDVDDYDARQGVGIEEIRGVDKLFYNNVQHGMVTVYTAGVADT